MNGMTRSLASLTFAVMLAGAAGTFGCGAAPDTSIEKAEAVEVTFYYLPG